MPRPRAHAAGPMRNRVGWTPGRTSSGVAFFLCSAPGVTMEGFSRMPSNSTLLSARYLKVSAQVASATCGSTQVGGRLELGAFE